MLEDEVITIELKSLTSLTFGEATDEEIELLLNAHYNGEIDLANYWKVGDTRLVQLTNLSSSQVTYVDQKMTMVIIGFNHDDLKEKAGERTKAAVTIQCRETFQRKGFHGNNALNNYDNDFNWLKVPMRQWYNQNFVNAMPETFNKLIKTVNKKNLKYHTRTDEAPIISEDKAFLLSVPEVIGVSSASNYAGTETLLEGEQYEYYKTSSNRVKYINNNGNKTETVEWWLRSPSSRFYGDGYNWMEIFTNGVITYSESHYSLAHSPAFCL